jgi:hypothetical protein
MDLSNLTKANYSTIRNFVKLKLSNTHNIDLKTCQLATVSSPKDYSKKLNSLAYKISSFNFRADITCEIFRDFTIGVIIWNEIFSNRKVLNLDLKNTYIYQTTKGTWKYTTINGN